MPRRTKKPGYIDWAKSKTKALIWEHLEKDILTLDENVISAQLAWTHYRTVDVVIQEKVVFEQFAEALARHRKAIKKKRWHVGDQMAALEHDTQFMSFNNKTHNRRGKKIFYGTDAHKQLKEDIKAEKHTTMGVEALFNSNSLYKDDEWNLAEFKKFVKTEEQTNKFHYHMEVKRTKKKEKAKKSGGAATAGEAEAATRASEREARRAAEAFDYYDYYQESDEDTDGEYETDEDEGGAANVGAAAGPRGARRRRRV